MPKRIRRKLSQEVADGILKMIMDGSIPSDQQIPTENELVSIFQVSRTAVREGGKLLVAIGVLETRHGIGTFVKSNQLGPLRYHPEISSPQSVALLEDLLEFRIIVEPEIAALAAQRRSQEDLFELERCVFMLKEHLLKQKSGKPPEDLGFHLALAKATRNSALVDASSMIIRFYEDDPYPPDLCDVLDHNAIFECIRDRKPLIAKKRMKIHLCRQREKYLKENNKPNGSEGSY